MILHKDGVDRYYLFDYETGQRYEVSKDYYEKYNTWVSKIWEDVKIKLSDTYKGIPIIMGTGDNLDKSGFEMFLNSEYKKDIAFIDNTWDNTPEAKFIKYFKPTYMPREFVKPEPLGDHDLMPSGKYKGDKMKDVPANYLLYIYESDMCSERVKEYIASNLEVLQKQSKADK